MATQLLTRTKSLFRSVHATKSPLSHAMKATKLVASKPSPRPLLVAYRQAASVNKITLPLLTTSTMVRSYSGREARKAQRQAAQTQVRDREPEPWNSEVVPVHERPVRAILPIPPMIVCR
jgi:hypothetical protein